MSQVRITQWILQAKQTSKRLREKPRMRWQGNINWSERVRLANSTARKFNKGSFFLDPMVEVVRDSTIMRPSHKTVGREEN